MSNYFTSSSLKRALILVFYNVAKRNAKHNKIKTFSTFPPFGKRFFIHFYFIQPRKKTHKYGTTFPKKSPTTKRIYWTTLEIQFNNKYKNLLCAAPRIKQNNKTKHINCNWKIIQYKLYIFTFTQQKLILLL